MKVYAIAADYMDQAENWYANACRYKRKKRKIECLQAAIPLFEYAEHLGLWGGQMRADGCRQKIRELMEK